MNEIAAKVRIANVRPRQFRVTADALGAVGRDEWRAPTFISRDDIFRERDPAPGVLPAGARIAQDDAVTSMISWASSGAFGEGIGFFGYQYLSELTQRPEYRRPVEIVAKEMTRKWVRFVVAADKDKSDRVKKLEAAFKKYKVQELFARAAEQDGFFGISHMFVDTGISDDRDALMTPLIRHKATIKKGSLNGFKIIEPLWTYPNGYNSDNPLRPDFYRPTSWFVMGKQVHSSRLLTFISREVPDILKPSYQFGGLSMTQLGKPYVDNWIRTRQSVSDLLHSFSTMVLATDMGVIMNAGAATDLVNRAMLFNQMRDNRGLMTINKDTEDLKNVSTPLSGLDKLQAQSQEHMSAVFGIPLVVLFGITPSGLNASSDSEIRVFYDWVHSQQEKLFRKNLLAVKEIIELSEFGDIDADISIEFEPLWQLDDAGLSAVQKTIADTHDIYLTQGVVSAEEVREVLGADEEGPYNGLDLSGPAPGPPEGASGADPSDPETNRIDEKGEEGSNSGALAGDKAFVESEHPRD